MLEGPAKQTKDVPLTFDSQDWFQVENCKQCISRSSWSECRFTQLVRPLGQAETGQWQAMNPWRG
jgi:hypothetical protein